MELEWEWKKWRASMNPCCVVRKNRGRNCGCRFSCQAMLKRIGGEMSNCEFCHKVLSKEKGEEDHGCLDCFGYISLINDVYVCFHCIETENRKLRDENTELKQKLSSVWKEAEEFYLDD